MELTFDKAIELLEITDISKVKLEDIPQIEKNQKRGGIPIKYPVLMTLQSHRSILSISNMLSWLVNMVYSFLKGTYQAGETFSQPHRSVHEEPEEIIRKNALGIQTPLKDLWNSIKEKKYKWTVKEVLLSDGFKLKDLLSEDFKEDIAMLSTISFFYGLLFLGILTAIAGAINPVLGGIVGIVWLLQAISCILGFAPLSRFWLNEQISTQN